MLQTQAANSDLATRFCKPEFFVFGHKNSSFLSMDCVVHNFTSQKEQKRKRNDKTEDLRT